MLEVTDKAVSILGKQLGEEAGNLSFRLTVSEGENPQLMFDDERPGDRTFEYQGKPVLVIQDKLCESLDGKTLDARLAGGQPALTLR